MSRAVKYTVYRVLDSGDMIQATHPCGEPAYTVGIDSLGKFAESQARTFAIEEPGVRFVVVDPDGVETFSVIVEETRRAA